jgi:ech hydrogenase subunit E
MGEHTIIPFGPQHPVLPEPIHLDLELDDETVIQAIPSIGFVHRGLEKLVEKKDFQEFVYVAERICGICSFVHGMGYCVSIEKGMEIDVPDRAEFLRTFWSELARIHSHVMWLGLLGDAFGFESLFMHCWRVREKVLDIFDMTTGGRVIFSVCKIGGVRRDIDEELFGRIRETLNEIYGELTEITNVFLRDTSVKHRTVGLGKLTPEEALTLGAVGPMAKASSHALDMRTHGYAAYRYLTFEPITETAGDCYARTMVRVKEIFQSIRLIEQCLDLMPQDKTLETKIKGAPRAEFFARMEQPRGEAIYYTKGNGTKFLSRMRVRTPTFANLPALLHMLKGCQLADVPVLVLTIDPCISCTER